MSVSGPSPLGTLMVQRVEAALGVTLGQQANVAKGAGPDAVTQPGQPEKTDAAKNPPPKEHEGARRPQDQGGRQGGLAALARNDPEIAKLLAARNAPMTGYTASAPTSLGLAAKTILALLQQFPEARPAITGRAPLLGQSPGQAGAGAAGQAGGMAGAAGQAAAAPVGDLLDPRAVQALMQRAAGEGTLPGQAAAAGRGAPGSGAQPGAAPLPGHAAAAGAGATGATAGGTLAVPTGMAGQLAQALSSALQGSGLFYESHLRDLTFGHRTLAQLRAEPQAQAGQAATGHGHAAGEGAQARSSAEGTAGANPAQAGNQAAGQAASQAASQAAQAAQASQAAHFTSTHLAGALLGLDPSTHALVRQQLETLANQAVAWQGEAWPGTEMEWEVQRREPSEGDAEAPDSWATRLKLNLPGLGEVQARLSLAGGQLVMHLVAPSGADLMADHTELLRQRLTHQGLQLSHLTISRDATDTPVAADTDTPEALP